MPSASSTSSTRRRIASCVRARGSRARTRGRARRGRRRTAPRGPARRSRRRRRARVGGACASTGRTRRRRRANRPPLACGTRPFAAAQQRALARARRRRRTSSSSPGSTSRSTPCERARAPRRGTRYGARRAGSRASRSPLVPTRGAEQRRHEQREQRERRQEVRAWASASGLANQTRLLSPTIEETAAIATGASTRSRPRASRPAVMRRGRYRVRARCSDDARTTARTEPERAGEAEHRGERAALTDRARRTHPPSASSDTTPAPPGGLVARTGTGRAKPRESIDSASVTARSMPELEHRHDLAQQPAPPHDRAAGAGAVGVAHVARSRRASTARTRARPRPRARARRTARGVDCTSSECETTRLNAPNTAITPTMAKPSASDCSTTVQLDGAADGEAAEQLGESRSAGS